MAGPIVSTVPRTLALGRFAKSLLVARGDHLAALAFAESQRWADTPSVVTSLKAAVAALDTTNDPGGAGLSLSNHPVAMDFSAVIRPMTVLGRLAGLHSVPFNCRMLSGATGTSAFWRGEGWSVPVSKLDFDAATLSFARLDSMSVVTKELAMHSAPSAPLAIAADMAKAAAAAADIAFLDPENSGSAGVRPASITNGITPITSTGSTLATIDADLRGAVEALGDADLSTAAWVMRPKTALYLATLRGTGGSNAYPLVTAKGGSLLGLPVLTSNAVTDANSPTEAYIALVSASGIAVADDGDSLIEFSEHASVVMTDVGVDGATAEQQVSLWAHGLLGVRASRAINWRRMHANAVAVITSVQY